MDDLIKRQDAIDACFNGKVANNYDCAEAIEKLPSAEKTGKWIPEFGEYWFRCSCCGKLVPGGLQNGYRHCPNCGSKNRGEEE